MSKYFTTRELKIMETIEANDLMDYYSPYLTGLLIQDCKFNADLQQKVITTMVKLCQDGIEYKLEHVESLDCYCLSEKSANFFEETQQATLVTWLMRNDLYVLPDYTFDLPIDEVENCEEVEKYCRWCLANKDLIIELNEKMG